MADKVRFEFGGPFRLAELLICGDWAAKMEEIWQKLIDIIFTGILPNFESKNKTCINKVEALSKKAQVDFSRDFKNNK